MTVPLTPFCEHKRLRTSCPQCKPTPPPAPPTPPAAPKAMARKRDEDADEDAPRKAAPKRMLGQAQKPKRRVASKEEADNAVAWWVKRDK